jgi:hypothetical protein
MELLTSGFRRFVGSRRATIAGVPCDIVLPRNPPAAASFCIFRAVTSTLPIASRTGSAPRSICRITDWRPNIDIPLRPMIALLCTKRFLMTAATPHEWPSWAIRPAETWHW